MILQITLTPLEPYFLGGERVFSFKSKDAGPQSQLTNQNSYFIRSEELPTQSALFGVLRYLGIRNPKASFKLDPEDKAQIGENGSFLLCDTGRTFGKIRRISALRMVHGSTELGPVPAGMPTEAEEGCKCVIKNAKEPQKYVPYTAFLALPTSAGTRLVPKGYNEKIWPNAQFFDPASGDMFGCLFHDREQVGINRAQDNDGYFKKVYKSLEDGFAFRYYAETDDDFVFPEQRIVYLGQGKSAFSAVVRKTDETVWPVISPAALLPKTADIGGAQTLYYLYAESDVYYSGKLSTLKANCSLMLAQTRNYRSFTTNNDQPGLNRYRKHEQAFHLTRAGALFVFTDTEQREAFLNVISADPYYKNGQTAGFNNLIKVHE